MQCSINLIVIFFITQIFKTKIRYLLNLGTCFDLFEELKNFKFLFAINIQVSLQYYLSYVHIKYVDYYITLNSQCMYKYLLLHTLILEFIYKIIVLQKIDDSIHT